MENFPLPAPTFDGRSRSVPPGNAFEWFKQGWTLFLVNPGMWVAIALLSLLVFLGVQVVPWVGALAAYLLTPLLLAGLLQVADKASKGEKIEINDMFAGFRVHSRQLVQVGVLYMVGMLIILMVAAMISGGSMASGLLLGQMAGAGMAVGGMVLALLVSLVLSVPLMMGVWFAPALVLFNGMEAVDALKASFAANLKNLVPMLVYGIFVLVLAFFAALPAGLGFLVLAPVLAGSIYAQYRDLFVAR